MGQQISLKEYAAKWKMAERSIRYKAESGGSTAHKIGYNWMIDEDEPYIDLRTQRACPKCTK